MDVRIFKESSEELRFIAESWKKESGGFNIEMNIEEHLKDLQYLIDSNDTDLLVLYDKEPVGYMGVFKFKNPTGTEYFANDRYWYVLPNKRIGAIRLLWAVHEWAKNNGCKYLLMSINKLAGNMHNKVCKLYEKTGFEHFETTYIKRV